MIGTTPRDHPQISRENIKKGCGITIQAIQPYEDGGGRKPKCGSIAGDHLGSLAQVAAVVPVARRSERAEKLMRMCLKHNCTGTNHFPPLAALIAWRTYLIKPARGSRQGVRLWQCPLTGGSSGSIHVNYQPLPACPVEQATRGRKRVAGKQILLKACAQGFHRGLVESRQKPGQG